MYSNEIEIFSKSFFDLFNTKCKKFTKQDIENADGRKLKNKISKTGSILYVVFDNSDKVLYVGETGKSIKRRFISDGHGSHKRKNSNWYNNMEYLLMLCLDNNEVKHRKLLEQSLSVSFKPRYYNDYL